MRMRTPISVLAAMLLASPAFAADQIPGSSATDETIRIGQDLTRGLWEMNPDSDWYRVRLTKGQDYAIRFIANDVSATATATLRDPQGKPLKSVGYNYYGDAGFEYRPTKTAVFFLDAKGALNDETPDRRAYALSVTVDCRDAATTKCSLDVGKKKGETAAWVSDYDRFSISLDKAKRYTFSVDAPAESTACEAKLLDARGNTVAEAKYTIDDPAQISDFKPKASGKHYLRAICDLVEDFGTSYEVLVTAR